MLPWKLRKHPILPVNQNLWSLYFSLAEFQLVSRNLSLAMIFANDIHSQTAKTVFSHLNITVYVIFVCDVLTLSDNISFHFVYCSLGDLEIVLKMWTQYFYILARILTLWCTSLCITLKRAAKCIHVLCPSFLISLLLVNLPILWSFKINLYL